jgi:diguanylate cyclase (GGDEF)-like protein
MELRAYLRTLTRKWWIILITFVVTYAATLALTFTQTPVYQSRATFIMKLSPAFRSDKDSASSLDILSRQPSIAATYTTLASSRMIRGQVADALNVPGEQRRLLTVTSSVIPDTNVLAIMVQAPDPVLARDFTNAVGAATVEYVRGLYEVYELEPLDRAGLSDAPILPNKPLNLLLGAVVGLGLGVGVAFLAAYLQAPAENLSNVGVLDDETGVYNQRYFTMRLRQEMSRARRNGYPLSVALMDVDHRGVLDDVSGLVRHEALRYVARRLHTQLRDEDVMARFDDTVFAFLLPDLHGERAKAVVEELADALVASPLELDRSGARLDLHSSAGVVSYLASDAEVVPDAQELLAQATEALGNTKASFQEQVVLFSQNGDRAGVPRVPGVSGVPRAGDVR